MAVKEFNCNKLKRTFWPFTLKDKTDEAGNVTEKGKKILVRMPQKHVLKPSKTWKIRTRATPLLKIRKAFTVYWQQC